MLFYILSGFGVGFLVGMTGVGGGSLMTPLLVLAMGVAPAVAVGTDLLFAGISKTVGAFVHSRSGLVHWRVVGWLALGSLPSSFVTLHLLADFVPQAALDRLITHMLGFALILTAAALLVLDRFRARRPVEITPGTRRLAWTVTAGAALGALVTISSVGAGALGVVVLMALHSRLRTAEVVATDIAHAVPLTLFAGVGHATFGTVDFALLGALLIGSLPGIYLGSRLASRAPERVLRSTLAVLLALVGGKFVF